MAYLYAYVVTGLLLSITTICLWVWFRSRIDKPATARHMCMVMMYMLLLWPLMVSGIVYFRTWKAILSEPDAPLIPRIDPEKARQEARQRSEEFYARTPVCGETVAIRGESPYWEPLSGVFVMPANAVRALLASEEVESTEDPNSMAIHWLDQRVVEVPMSSYVPKKYFSLTYLIPPAINQRVGQCYCLDCKTLYEMDQLTYASEMVSRAWQWKVARCPQQHMLFAQKGIHFHFADDGVLDS